MSRPSWILADDIDRACQAIVQAVNNARTSAAKDMNERFQRLYPEAYELLDDLRPGGEPERRMPR